MQTLSQTVIRAASAASEQTSATIAGQLLSSLSLQVVVAGGSGIVGVLYVDGSNEETPVNWYNPVGASISVSGNVSTGTVALGVCYRWLRARWVPSAGTGGTISVAMMAQSGPSPMGPYANGLVETSGPTPLLMGAVPDDYLLARSGTDIIGVPNSLPSLALFGDGSDGVVAISAGTTTLTRPMNYSTLTLSGSGALRTQAYPVMCSVELDVSAAPANAITYLAGTGANGISTGAGGGAATNASNHLPAGQASVTGGVGNVGAGSIATNLTAQVGAICGGIATSGAGGLGSSGSGGGNRAGAAPATTQWQPFVVRGPLDPWLRIATQMVCGGAGQSGGGGGGDGTAAGGGGAGGQGGQFVGLWTKLLRRSASSAAGAIAANGGIGGNGGSPAAGARGGGGGGGGGSGGCVYIVAGGLAGTSATDLLSAAGGVGGTGGLNSGAGVAGTGGTGGYGGLCVLFNLSTGTLSKTNNRATAGTGPTGRTGGPGATCTLTV